MAHITLYQQIGLLPEHLKIEVLKYVEMLLQQQKKETKVKKKRQFGFAKGKITISPDFNAPLEDFNEYM